MQAILDKIAELKIIAEQKGYPLPPFGIRFDLKGTTAGQARRAGGKYAVRFNLAIARENIDEFLVRTVPHELAHLLQFVHRPIARPHGAEWQNFCRVLTGKTMPRCHSYEVAHLKRKRRQITKNYLYVCNCATRTHRVSSLIHGKIVRGASYSCGKCRTKISFLKQDFSLDSI